MPYCQSGKHYWLDEVSAERCCNPLYHRTTRLATEPPLEGEMPDGQVLDRELGILHIWIKTEGGEQAE